MAFYHPRYVMLPRDSHSRSLNIQAFVLLMLLASSPAFAMKFASQHQKHDYKREVELLEEQWRVAQLTGDVATMDRLLSDDFVGISMTGQVNTKTQQLSRIRNHSFVITRIDLGDMKIKLVGEVAIVTVRAAIEGTSQGVPMNGLFRYTRVYQHLPGGGWKITNFEATRIPMQHLADSRNPGPERKPS